MSTDPNQPPPQYPPAYYPPPAAYYPPPAYAPPPFPDVTQGPESPPLAPARRSPSTSLLLGVIASLLFIVAGTGAYFVYRDMSRHLGEEAKKEMAPQQVERLERLIMAGNQSWAWGEQIEYWTLKEQGGVAAIAWAEDERTRWSHVIESEDWKLQKELGKDYPSMGQVNKAKSLKLMTMIEKTKEFVRAKLTENRTLYMAETVEFLDQRKDDPLRIIEFKKQEPIMLKKWTEITAKAIQQEIARLEAEARRP
mgnify:FL=1